MLLFHCSQAAVEGLTTRRKGQPESWVTHEPFSGAGSAQVTAYVTNK